MVLLANLYGHFALLVVLLFTDHAELMTFVGLESGDFWLIFELQFLLGLVLFAVSWLELARDLNILTTNVLKMLGSPSRCALF